MKHVHILLGFIFLSMTVTSTAHAGWTTLIAKIKASLAATQVTVSTTSSPRSYSPMESEVMTLINQYRANLGKSQLLINDYLSQKAEAHDDYMISIKSATHNGFTDREADIKRVLGAVSVGEIIAYNFNSADSVVSAWINSYSHKTIIEGDYNRIGIAIKQDPVTLKSYFTVLFAKI